MIDKNLGFGSFFKHASASYQYIFMISFLIARLYHILAVEVKSMPVCDLVACCLFINFDVLQAVRIPASL